ncbi:hypothetical protein YC2023_023139 [Brassica napus]
MNSNNILSRKNRSRSSIFPAKECQQVMDEQGSSGDSRRNLIYKICDSVLSTFKVSS